MAKVEVEVVRSFTCTVEVEVEDGLEPEDAAEAALDAVEKDSFELPPRDEWQGMKDWGFTVYDEDGEPLVERGSR